jgi:hypothetical protein
MLATGTMAQWHNGPPNLASFSSSPILPKTVDGDGRVNASLERYLVPIGYADLDMHEIRASGDAR